MSDYKHFSYQERAELSRLLHGGASKAAIADRLDRPRSTINREIRRNANKGGIYNPDTAQRRCEARRRRGCKLDRNTDLGTYVVDQLHENWTPEQIAGCRPDDP